MIDLSIAVSTVTGRFMLKPDLSLETILLNCWFRVVFLAVDVEGGNSEALIIVTTYYYTLLQQLLLHCYFIHVDINCWLILPPSCKTRRKMLVFDRPSIFPLTLVVLSCSPLYILFIHFDTS